jgi:capsid protein
MINYLEPGEEIAGFNPTQPGQNFPDAIAAFARFVGLRFGLTLEQVLLDFSRTNYSSARAARIQAEQTAYQEQDDFAASFFTRVYVWCVAKWMKAGLITVPAPDDWYAMEWIPQGKPWVDPTKEISAAAQAVALGVDARSHIAAERGYDFRELTKVNQEDVALLTAAGLPTDPSGGPPPAPIIVQPVSANG